MGGGQGGGGAVGGVGKRVQNSAGKREIVPDAAVSWLKLVVVSQIYPVEEIPQDTWSKYRFPESAGNLDLDF